MINMFGSTVKYNQVDEGDSHAGRKKPQHNQHHCFDANTINHICPVQQVRHYYPCPAAKYRVNPDIFCNLPVRHIFLKSGPGY